MQYKDSASNENVLFHGKQPSCVDFAEGNTTTAKCKYFSEKTDKLLSSNIHQGFWNSSSIWIRSANVRPVAAALSTALPAASSSGTPCASPPPTLTTCTLRPSPSPPDYPWSRWYHRRLAPPPPCHQPIAGPPPTLTPTFHTRRSPEFPATTTPNNPKNHNLDH
jgi:hypothetical protein